MTSIVIYIWKQKDWGVWKVNSYYEVNHGETQSDLPSRVKTAQLKQHKKRNKALNFIRFFLLFCVAVAVSYYSSKFFPRESGTGIYLIGVFISSIVTMGFWFLVFSSFQKK